MNVNLILLLASVLINTSLLFVIALNKKREIFKVNTITFVLSVAFLVFWSIANYLADSSASIDMALFWTRATFPASAIMLFFIVWFSYEFPSKRKNYNKIITVYSVFIVIFLFASMNDFVVSSVYLQDNFGITDVALGPLYPATIVLYLVFIFNLFFNYYKQFQKSNKSEKDQIFFIILGWGAFLVGSILTNLVLPFITGNALWSKFGPMFSVFMVGLTTYSIVKYHFLDIKLIIQRSIVYSSILFLIVSLYLSLVFIVGYFFQKNTSLTYGFSAILTTIAGIAGVNPIKKIFTRVTDKIFYKNKYNYNSAIENLSEIVNHNITSEDLLKKTTTKIKKLLKPSQLFVYLLEKRVIYDNYQFKKPVKIIPKNFVEILSKYAPTIIVSSEIPHLKLKNKNSNKNYYKTLEQAEIFSKKHKIDLFVNLKAGNKIIAIIFMGEKLSGDMYSQDDLQLLKTFSYQAAVALEKARYYEKLKNYSKDLKVQVKERTKEINELQRSQKRMIVDVSHNLQTPLTIIKTQLSELEKQFPENNNIFAFEKSIDKLSSFIYNLLKLSRMETGKIVAEKTSYNLSDAFKEMVEYFGVIVEDKNIKITHKIEPGIIINADRQKIEELISNVVSNAIKYIGKGNEINIKLEKINGNALITIKDDGVGMHKENLDKIFKRFYRIKNRENSEIGGSGLGLAFCQMIVDLHKGKINVKSEPGKGTSFIVALPLK